MMSGGTTSIPARGLDRRAAEAARKRAYRAKLRASAPIPAVPDTPGARRPSPGRTLGVLWERAAPGPGLARLALSDGATLTAEPGGRLATVDALRWLVEQRAGYSSAVLVMVDVDELVNHLIVDLHPSYLTALAKNERARFRAGDGYSWLLEWLPGHSFTAALVHIEVAGGRVTTVRDRTVTVWDVGLAGRPVRPCHLGAWYQRTRLRLSREFDISVRRHDGQGAIAAAMLAAHDVKRHLPRTPAPRELEDDVFPRAYIGGRIEDCAVGWFPTLYSYDLNSAYPAALAQLPSLAHGRWERASSYEPGAWGVYRVQWAIPEGEPLGPLPWRDPKGNISYPETGHGWYWSPEIDLALRVWGDCVSVEDGWVWRPTPGTNVSAPFGWLRELYAARKRLDAAGDDMGRVLKLGMAAVYGKLAQAPSERAHGPGYRSLAWAGMCCSLVRAWVTSAAVAAGRAIVAISTDAVYSTEPIDSLVIGAGLGEWKAAVLADVLWVANGLYAQGIREDATAGREKTRGFVAGELSFTALLEAWDGAGIGARVVVPLTRPVNLHAAVRGGLGLARWHQRITIEQVLAFAPSGGKWPEVKGVGSALHRGRRGHIRLLPAALPARGGDDRLSARYEPERHGWSATRDRTHWLLPRRA